MATGRPVSHEQPRSTLNVEAPIVLIADGLGAHKSVRMGTSIAARPSLGGYAPEPNPGRDLWSTTKRGSANLPSRTATASRSRSRTASNACNIATA
jgi:hypothetical protein